MSSIRVFRNGKELGRKRVTQLFLGSLWGRAGQLEAIFPGPLVCYTALRDDTKNGCVADYRSLETVPEIFAKVNST